MRLDFGLQRRLDGMTGRVRSVYDAPMAMSALTGQVIPQIAGVPSKRHPLADKPFDCLSPVFDDIARGCGITQARSGDFRIANMIMRAVLFGQDCRNSALRPVRSAIQQFAFGKDAYLAVIR